MKNILIGPALLFVCVNTFAQQAQVFKMSYQPGLTYTITQTVSSVTSVDFTGEKAELDKLPVAQLPIVLQNRSNLKYMVTTGAENSKNFSGNVLFLNSDNDRKINGEDLGAATDSLKSKKFYGGFAHDIFKLDSLKYLKLADSLKQQILTLVNGTRIDFPDRPLKPGDTFTQDVPMNMPVSGRSVTVNIQTVYKLVSVKNTAAFFDVSQNATLKTHTDMGDMEINGNGSGQIFYDMQYGFFRSYQNNLKLIFSMQQGKLTMIGTSNIFSVFKTDITVK